jgi:transposase-like protein
MPLRVLAGMRALSLIRFGGHLPRWMRCPAWDQTTGADGPGGGSRMSSGPAPYGWSLDEGKTIGAVARELDLTESSLATWVKARERLRLTHVPGLICYAFASSAQSSRQCRRLAAKSSRTSREYAPCFQRARRLRSRPSGVRGPTRKES